MLFKNGSIFLAEDNAADVYLFEEALKVHGVGCNLIVCNDGESAMSFLHRAEKDGPTPEILVLDLNLPKVGGLEILKHVRDSSHFAHVPVIVLTSGPNPTDREECRRLGADRYIQKASAVDDFIKIGGVVKEMIGTRHGDNGVRFPKG
jgi:CheY-like chemotaxis protein